MTQEIFWKLKNIFYLTKNKILLIISFILILTLYIFKAIYIFPLNFGADEVGHISYIDQIKKINTIPRYTETYLIEDEVFFEYDYENQKYKTGRKNKYNWIAKHPPLYYYLNAKIINLIDPNNQFSLVNFSKLTRILSSIFLSLSFLIIVKCLLKSKVSLPNSILYSLALFTTPLIIVTASTTTNDSLVFFLSTCAFYFFYSFILEKKTKDIFFLSLIISFLLLTKITSLILFVTLIFVFSIFLFQKKIKLKILILFLFLSLSLFLIYFFYKQNFLIDNTNIIRFPKKERFDEVNILYEYIKFIFDQNVIGSQLRHLYFMGGWGGSGRTIFITDFKLLFFLIVLLFAIFLCLISVSKKLFLKLEKKNFIFRIIFFVPFLIFLINLNVSYVSLDYFLSATILSSILIISLFCFFLILLGDSNKVEYYGFIIFAFFLLILDIKLLEGLLYKGKYSALHGRYLYPVIPFLFISIIKEINNICESKFFLFSFMNKKNKNLKVFSIISILLIFNSSLVYLIDVTKFLNTIYKL